MKSITADTFYECRICGRAYMESGIASFCHPDTFVKSVDPYLVMAAIRRKLIKEPTYTVKDIEDFPDESPRRSDLYDMQEPGKANPGKNLEPEEKHPHNETEDGPCELTEWGDQVVTHTSGAKRANGDKIRWDLMPVAPMRDTALIWTFGANKYGDRNWEQGFDWSGPYASLQRHLQAWFSGEDFDKESGMSHLAHAACNLQMLQQFEYTHKEGDNRPHNSCPPTRKSNAERQENESTKDKNKKERHLEKKPTRW